MKRKNTILIRIFVPMLIMLISLTSVLPVSAVIITGTVNEIVLSKTAAETTDGAITDEYGNIKQTYDINLAVKGKVVYPGAPVDIVMAIDLSNSMTSDGSRNLEVTKSAAINFINTVLADSDTAARIAIVTYGTYARAYNFKSKASKYEDKWDLYGSTLSSDVYYTNDKKTAVSVLNNSSFKPSKLNPTGKGTNYTSYESGGTNTEAGFKITNAITETRNRSQAASIVLFMTDGIPTYRLSNSGSIEGEGSQTSALDFNNAVSAAMALKQAGNQIYTVGLLTSYVSNSYQMDMANKLLSSESSYSVSGSGSNWTYTKLGGAYSTKYYPVYSASDALTNLTEIYTTLTTKSFSLASGTVTDIIPVDYELLPENKQDLLDMGYQVTNNVDGTTTITFNNVLASEDVSVLPVIKVQYKGNGYGSDYLNVNANYTGVLYDSTPFNLSFAKPVAGLIPATVDDTTEAVKSESISIGVTENDLFDKDGFSVEGNSVTDHEILLCDENGNVVTYTTEKDGFSAIVNNGNIVFNSPNIAAKTFFYMIKATVTPNSEYAKNNASVLISRPTKVTVTITEPMEPDTSIDLKGVNFAYIFGYEPRYKTIINENGETVSVAEVRMAMDDSVTREQVAAMLMRLIDQNFNTYNVNYPVSNRIKSHTGQWYERGLAYMDAKGAFDGLDYVGLGPVTRGEVAKLITCGMQLSKSVQTSFTDIDDSTYAPYIRKVAAYGYMNGMSETTFKPDLIMTRAQFCMLFNNIIGRNDKGLTALDEKGNEYEITAETYNFIDMNPSHWAYEVCLKATSAYDENGYVDIKTRQSNIRNKLDKYNAQIKN